MDKCTAGRSGPFQDWQWKSSDHLLLFLDNIQTSDPCVPLSLSAIYFGYAANMMHYRNKKNSDLLVAGKLAIKCLTGN
jgi:hypothetical protein